MAQKEENWRKKTDLQKEAEVRNGQTRFHDENRRLQSPSRSRQGRQRQEESAQAGYGKFLLGIGGYRSQGAHHRHRLQRQQQRIGEDEDAGQKRYHLRRRDAVPSMVRGALRRAHRPEEGSQVDRRRRSAIQQEEIEKDAEEIRGQEKDGQG